MADADLIRRIRLLEQRVAKLETKPAPFYLADTYVPTYLGGTTAGVTTYTVQLGFWQKIGLWILVQGALTWTAATGTGNAQVSLPFTPASRGSGSLWTANVTFANGTPTIQLAATSFFLMYSPLTNAAGAIVQMEAAGDLRFTCIYKL